MIKSISRQQGFTLLELFVALSIGLFLFAGVMSVFVGLRTTSAETSSYGEMQENGRFAISLLTDDLMRVGFWGELSGDLNQSVLQNIGDVSMTSDCVGEGINNGTFPGATGHFRVIWGDTVTNKQLFGCSTIDNAKIGTDVLQIKRVISSPTAAADIDGGRFYLRANGNYGEIFHGNEAAASRPVIENAQDWEYQHHIYYIEDDVRGNNTVPELHRAYLHIKNDSGSAGSMDSLNMVDGVEQMRIMFGIDNNNDGIVDSYLSDTQMTATQWDQHNSIKIIAAQIYILVRDINPDLNYENKNTYRLGDRSVTVDDNYRRMVFSSTVALNNARIDIW